MRSSLIVSDRDDDASLCPWREEAVWHGKSCPVSCCGDKSVPAGDLHPSGQSSLDSRSCCQLLSGVENSCGNFCVAFCGEVDVVAVRDLLNPLDAVWTFLSSKKYFF